MPFRIPFWLKFLAWVGVICWACTIYYFSSMTGPELEKIDFTFWDKAAHFVAFFAGGVALVIALRWSTKMDWVVLSLVAYVALNTYGMTDEIHQMFTPNRTGADLLDFLADALGAAAGIITTSTIYAFIQRKSGGTPAAD